MKPPDRLLFATRDKARYVGVADDALWMLDIRSGKAITSSRVSCLRARVIAECGGWIESAHV